MRTATGGLATPTVITSDDTAGTGDDVCVLNDRGHQAHVFYGASAPSLYLIRPDGYVGFRCHAADEAGLVDCLRRHYGLVASTQAEPLDACFS